MTDICPANSYTGSGPTLPAVSYLCTDHAIYSPSGVYGAILQDNGNFLVFRGTDSSNASVAWATGKTSPNGGPGSFFAATQGDGNFVIYGPNDNSQPFYATNTAQSTQGNYFASLADNGAFTVNAGTPASPGRQLYNNGVNDPVVSTNVSSITYDLAAQTVSLPTQLASAKQNCDNLKSNLPLTCNISVALSYTDTNTYMWSKAVAIAGGIKSTTKLALPGVDQSFEFSLMKTTTITDGMSDAASEAQTFTGSGSIVVPPYSKYTAQITAEQVTGSIPFTWTGTADYQNGESAVIDGSGMYDGTGSTDFSIVSACVTNPDGCGPPQLLTQGPSLMTPSVPEPSSALLLPMAILATAIVGRLRLHRSAGRVRVA